VSGSWPRVYVVTLNWNRAAETCACVESVLQSDYPRLSVIVCDNASEPESVADIRHWLGTQGAALRAGEWRELDRSGIGSSPPGSLGECVLIHTGGNLGFAGGMNVGVQYALQQQDADYVWLLNNDAVVDRHALSALVDHMRADLSIGICGSTLLEFTDRRRVEGYGGATYEPWLARSRAIGAFSDIGSVPQQSQDVERGMAYVIGASMLVSRRLLEAIGLMDESYFLYSEELDWALRARRAGFRLGYASRSLVYHKQGSSIGTSPQGGSDLSLFYLYRAKVMFTARHYRWLLPSVLAWLGWESFKFVLKGSPRKARATLRGMVAAWTGAHYQ